MRKSASRQTETQGRYYFKTTVPGGELQWAVYLFSTGPARANQYAGRLEF
ncbi:hypothetical protein ABID99_003480 [Mucilaginibacter sp. OAE612]